jgi:hypothetical protein
MWQQPVGLPVPADFLRKEDVMDDPVRIIAAIQGSPSAAVQDLFRALVDRWPSLRIAGVIAEDHGLADRFCSAGYLRRIGTSERFAIFEDRGPGGTVCHLDGGGALTAAEAVRRDIAAGCDLVLLSKFGKLEAAGEGLSGAFRAAIDGGIPLLTSVSPAAARAWEAVAVSGFTALSADPAEVDAWIEAVRPGGRGEGVSAAGQDPRLSGRM